MDLAQTKRHYLVGRDQQLERLTAGVLSAVSDGAQPVGDDADSAIAFLVCGDPGIGKSALLEEVAERAGAAGMRVLSAAGHPDTSLSSFAGLRQLLQPLLPHVPALQGQLGLAVRAVAEAGGSMPATVDRALLIKGVLCALCAAAADNPLLICVDDLEQLDNGSRDVLLAVVGRLSDAADERIAVALAQRSDAVAEGAAVQFELIDLRPLDAVQSTALLDSLPCPPTGRVRLEVLRCAAGNPLALFELSRLAASDAGRSRLAGGALPVTDTLLAVFGGEVETMPPPTRRALLLAAAGERRLRILEASPADVKATAWGPAEAAGLIVISGQMVRFRHPLVESAVLQSASEPERRRAHELLAAVLADDPGRRAWHLSSSSPLPDETVAAELSAYAEDVEERGDAIGAATLLQRAAEISAPGPDRARRLIRAAGLAGSAGQVGWVQELTASAAETTGDTTTRVLAAALAGWALVMAERPAAALDRMLPAARRLVDEHVPEAELLVDASALPVYTMGDDRTVARFREIFTTVTGAAAADSLPVRMLFPAAIAAPGQDLVDRLAAWPEPPAAIADSDHFAAAATIGGATYVLDESRLVIRHLTPVVDAQRKDITYAPALTCSAALGWAWIDVGRWNDAADNAQEMQRVSIVRHLPVLSDVAAIQLAITVALRGPRSAAATALSRAQAAAGNPALAAHLTTLRSRVAAADGDFVAAFEHLAALFADDGSPRHRHLASLAIGDLASAARRIGRAEAARKLIEPLLDEERWRSTRQRLVDARAAALLGANGTELLERLTECASDPAGAQWPLERALTYLDVADAARASRQVGPAREALLAAIDIFEQLGARTFEERSRGELRATGIQVAPVRADALASLTEQQRQIVMMAADGLTNQEIGLAMFLSPRTVGSHLYRAFPKMGISSRAQLPAVLSAASEPAAP